MAKASSINLMGEEISFDPAEHKSTETTYGVGNDTEYGHLKLTDDYTNTSDVTGGTAVTPKALKDGLDTKMTVSVSGTTLVFSY